MYRNLSILFFFTLLWLPLGAQIPNLVPNPSFEELSSCPSGRGQIDAAAPWYSPNGGGIETYHRCAAGTNAGVPNNMSGFQQPIDGDGYAGIRIWREGGLYREYLTVKLEEPLIPGEMYSVGFWVSPGDSIAYVSDDLGLALTPDAPPSFELMPYEPILNNPEGELIQNFGNWKHIQGQYEAQGGETYVLIGNFEDENESTVERREDSESLNESVYEYIDQVEIIPCSYFFPKKLISAPKDSICAGDELSLNAYVHPDLETKITWPDSSSTPQYQVVEPGVYRVEVEIYGCSQTEDFQVFQAPGPDIQIGRDTTLCEGETLLLEANLPQGTFSWNDGSSAPSLQINTPGVYGITASDGNCSNTKEIAVQYLSSPSQELPFDTLICDGLSVQLGIRAPEATYLWQDGSTEDSISVYTEGNYELIVSTRCYSEGYKFHVQTQSCDCQSFFPNVFSPNQDGIHDRYVVDLSPGTKNFSCFLYDRWGRKIHQSNDPQAVWDGTFETGKAKVGTYYYQAAFECLENGTFITTRRKGTLMLLR